MTRKYQHVLAPRSTSGPPSRPLQARRGGVQAGQGRGERREARGPRHVRERRAREARRRREPRRRRVTRKAAALGERIRRGHEGVSRRRARLGARRVRAPRGRDEDEPPIGRGPRRERGRGREGEEAPARARPALDPVRTGPGRLRPTARGARAAAEDSETNVSFRRRGRVATAEPRRAEDAAAAEAAEELEMDRLFADSPVSPEGRMYERARR